MLKYADIQIDNTEVAVVYIPEYIQDTEIWKMWLHYRVMCPKDADRMANSEILIIILRIIML